MLDIWRRDHFLLLSRDGCDRDTVFRLARPAFDRIRVISCMVEAVTDAAVSEAEPFGLDYFQDPLGYFARVRQQGPVVPVQLPDGGRYWLITRYADVRAALADPRLHKDYVRKLAGPDWQPDPMTFFLNVHM